MATVKGLTLSRGPECHVGSMNKTMGDDTGNSGTRKFRQLPYIIDGLFKRGLSFEDIHMGFSRKILMPCWVP